MKINQLLLVCCLFWAFSSAKGQNTAAADAQHLILGQKAAGAGVSNSVPNLHPKAQWFPKAGLGLFVHFGMAALHGGIDLSWGMYANKSWEDGEISPADYWKLADRWNPVNFNPDDWVKKAADAGFQYIVFTTKHHDGYTMWPSEFGNFGVKQKMNGRDLVKEFVDACHKYNVKVGLYFSPPDWYFDAQYINWDYSGKSILDIHHKEIAQLPQKPSGHDEMRRSMVANQVRELLTKYGRIDLMWFDGGHGEITNDEIRHLQPGIVINRRNGEPGDYGDSEGTLPTVRFSGWFETNDPCWPSRWWSYSTSDRMDSGADVIEKLVILRAWRGNFLANVGPMPDGRMPQEALDAWKVIGEWMHHSGESVLGTSGGSFPEKANQPVTVRGDSVMYVHAFPNYHKKIIVQDVKKKPIKVVLLRTNEDIPFMWNDGILSVQIPAEMRSRLVDTVKLKFDR